MREPDLYHFEHLSFVFAGIAGGVGDVGKRGPEFLKTRHVGFAQGPDEGLEERFGGVGARIGSIFERQVVAQGAKAFAE